MLAKIATFVCGALLSPVKAIKSFFVWLYGFVMWAIKLYMAAHMFFRVFLANPTDAFSAAERTVMQCTMYPPRCCHGLVLLQQGDRVLHHLPAGHRLQLRPLGRVPVRSRGGWMRCAHGAG